MTAFTKVLATVTASGAIAGSLAGCGGDSSGPAPDPAVSSSVGATGSPSVPAGLPLFTTLHPRAAAVARHRLEGQPGVARTRYSAGSKRFYVYFTANATKEQRKHVRHVLIAAIRS
jgi:hypothetical protein